MPYIDDLRPLGIIGPGHRWLEGYGIDAYDKDLSKAAQEKTESI